MGKQKSLLLAIIVQLLLFVCACHQPAQIMTGVSADLVTDTKENKLPPQLKTGVPLDEQTAIQVAEKFIADNGYTDLPPMSDTSQLAHESIEWQSDAKQMLQLRQNTLERKAFSFSQNRQGGKMGWTIGFRYKGGTEGVGRVVMEELGRAVTMDLDGGNMRVEHVEVFLKKLERILRY
jgi:hypothetical protein